MTVLRTPRRGRGRGRSPLAATPPRHTPERRDRPRGAARSLTRCTQQRAYSAREHPAVGGPIEAARTVQQWHRQRDRAMLAIDRHCGIRDRPQIAPQGDPPGRGRRHRPAPGVPALRTRPPRHRCRQRRVQDRADAGAIARELSRNQPPGRSAKGRRGPATISPSRRSRHQADRHDAQRCQHTASEHATQPKPLLARRKPY